MGLFRRQRFEKPFLLDEADQALVGAWWQAAEDRLQAGQGDTSWLTGSIMLAMAFGYAVNTGSRVPPKAFSLLIRAGYALRMTVNLIDSPQPLDVSQIDARAVDRLATLPRVEDVGTLTTDLSPDDDALLEPIVQRTSAAAESSEEFAQIVSVMPAFWNHCVSIATERFQTILREQHVIRRARDLDSNTVESFLRYGFVLRALDEALGIKTSA